MDQKATINVALSAFVKQLRARDVEGASALFEEHAVLFGSEEGESAHGREGLREFFERIYRRPHTCAGPDCGLEGRSHARALKQSYAVLGTGLNAS